MAKAKDGDADHRFWFTEKTNRRLNMCYIAKIKNDITVLVKRQGDEDICFIGCDEVFRARVRDDSESLVTHFSKDIEQLKAGVHALFLSRRNIQRLCFPKTSKKTSLSMPLFHQGKYLLLFRDAFWQMQEPWLPNQIQKITPTIYSQTKYFLRHPLRPPYSSGELYRRYDHDINAWFSLRNIVGEADLSLFNSWQNDSRVSEYWEMPGDATFHKKYLEQIRKDPHVQGVFGCIDDSPFSYFEIYWAKEDRISPYYDARDYDRGIHMLVGDSKHRGPAKLRTWLTGLCHYIFISEPRTSRIVAEPRYDNAKMIGYMQKHRFAKVNEFDFPHKRASLLVLEREAFFNDCDLS